MLCYARERTDSNNAMRIRMASQTDLEMAAQLWYERIALLRESGANIALAPDAIDAWRQRARNWIGDGEYAFFIAEMNGTVIGLIVVTVIAGQPGLLPDHIGTIMELAVDLHQPHRGLSMALLGQAKAWLKSREVETLEIQAPAHYPVEDAFWRAQGVQLSSRKYRLQI